MQNFSIDRLPLLLFLCVLAAAAISGTGGCGTDRREQGTEENTEDSENIDTNLFDEGGSSLSMIQGDRIIGESLSTDRDSVLVVAALRGTGREWDIVCRRLPGTGEILLTAADDRARRYAVGEIDGLTRDRRLPAGCMLELAAANVTDEKQMDLLCAVGDGESTARLSVYRFVQGEPGRFVRIGALEGESYFIIRAGGTIEAPFGERGLARTYAWTGSAFESVQDHGF